MLYSEKNSYSIVVKHDYIGCVKSCRYRMILEDWTRGSDLPDGKCNDETLKYILLYILSCELLPYDDGSKPLKNQVQEDSDENSPID